MKCRSLLMWLQVELFPVCEMRTFFLLGSSEGFFSSDYQRAENVFYFKIPLPDFILRSKLKLRDNSG